MPAEPTGLARVLIIAGSDSGGGAGIQADIKTVTCLGGYAATAVTALTAQNTQGVHGIFPIPEAFIAQQIRVVLDDIGADVVKTGMLHSAATVETVAACLAPLSGTVPLVVDPVMVAKDGSPLLQTEAVDALKTRLIPMATLLTPNIPEAELLTGVPITNIDRMKQAGAALLRLGCAAALIKGGHLPGRVIYDLLCTPGEEFEVFSTRRIDSPHTHGTGCTLASAIAVSLAQDMSLSQAAARAREYVARAITLAPGLGHGHGPLHHGHVLFEEAEVD